MNVGIIGAKDFQPLSLVTRLVDHLPRETTIVITTQHGAPRAAEEHARLKGMKPCMKVPLGQVDRDDKVAWRNELKTRNENLVRQSDIVVAFWDGEDYGVREIAELCTKAGKPFFIISSAMDHELAPRLLQTIVGFVTECGLPARAVVR